MTDTSLPLHPFQGTIEGNGRTISNVNLSSDGRACGIIGYGRECTVRNLTLSDITVTAPGNGKARWSAICGTVPSRTYTS